MKRKNSKAYSGKILFPILGAETHQEFNNSCQFFGDFCFREKRQKIFAKPRKYTIEIRLQYKDFVDVTELATVRADMEQLCKILHEYATDTLKSNGGIICYNESFFSVRLT